MSIEEYLPFRSPPTIVVLILVNLFSIYGILAWNWDIFIILLLYWLENIVIGIINIIKLLVIEYKVIAAWFIKIFMIPFFTLHYGVFTAAHGMFILSFFGKQTALMDKLDQDPGIFVSEIFIILQEYSLLWVLSAIIASHLFSFFWHFIRQREWNKASLQTQMFLPYARVFILHFLVIFGGFLVAALSAPTGLLICVVLLKIVIDVILHIRSHAKAYK